MKILSKEKISVYESKYIVALSNRELACLLGTDIHSDEWEKITKNNLDASGNELNISKIFHMIKEFKTNDERIKTAAENIKKVSDSMVMAWPQLNPIKEEKEGEV